MNWKNDITLTLQIDYPVIQAPMFGVTTPEMVAAATTHRSLGRSFSPTYGQNAAGDQGRKLLRVIALQQG